MQQLLWLTPEFEAELLRELERKSARLVRRSGELLWIESPHRDWVWARAQALGVEELRFSSIREAQDLLKARGKLWWPQPASHFRRSELVAQGLRVPPLKPRRFGDPLPAGPLGVFSLVSENEMWVSPELSPAVPPDAWEFAENPAAPSRAYLKLWEALTRDGRTPGPQEHCLELGSAPGGWTWVLSEGGRKVTCVDKGEMAPEILSRPGVRWLRQDAFSLKPSEVQPVDWLFSDLICYPARLLELVEKWANEGQVRHFVCTIKFQGPTDFAALEAFLRLPGSKARHLRHNKHEVTWIWHRDS